MSTYLLKKGYSLILGVSNYTPKRLKLRKTRYAPVVRNGVLHGVNTYWIASSGGSDLESKPLTRMNVHFRNKQGQFVSWKTVEEYADQMDHSGGIKMMKFLRELPAHD